MQSNTQTKILGVLLIHDQPTVMNYLSRIKPEWFNNGFNRDVIDSIIELNQKGNATNLLTIVADLRSKKKLESSHVSKISQLTNNAPGDVLTIHSLFSQIEYEYIRTSIENFLMSNTRKVAEETFMPESFFEDFEKLKVNLESGNDLEETNEEVLNQVILDHDKAKQGELPGEKIGMPGITTQIILEPVDLMIIGARPAMGKTACAVTIACNKAFGEQKAVSMFCLEMSKKQMIRRIMAYISKIDSKRIRLGGCTEKEIEILRSIRNSKEFKLIHIHAGSHTSRDITRKLATDKRNHNVKLCIIDYLQKITVKEGKSEFEKTTLNSNATKYMVQNLLVPTIALAQIKRPDGKVRQPKLSDLRGSGDIEQDGSVVAFLHCPDYYDNNAEPNLGEFCLAKNREDKSKFVFNFTTDMTISSWGPYKPIHEIEKPKGKKGKKAEQDDLPF